MARRRRAVRRWAGYGACLPGSTRRRRPARRGCCGEGRAAALAGYAPVHGGEASPRGPMTMPLAQVLTGPVNSTGYSTVAYKGLDPIWAADGAAIPASAPGSWGQLHAAGRP